MFGNIREMNETRVQCHKKISSVETYLHQLRQILRNEIISDE